MLVSYNGEEPRHSRKASSEDYSSRENEERYKVIIMHLISKTFIKTKSDYHYDSTLLSKLYFLNYRLLSRSIDSSNSQSRPTEFGKNAVTHSHGLLVLYWCCGLYFMQPESSSVFAPSFQIYVCRPDL